MRALRTMITAGCTAVASLGLPADVASAKDFPSDAQVQAAFGTLYDHLGLMEYCTDKGFATAADVAAARLEVSTVTAGMTVSPEARSHEAQGRGGVILGKQIIGLMNLDAPTHPELIPEGRTMTLSDNARAQKLTERSLCGQMAAQEQAQTAPLRKH